MAFRKNREAMVRAARWLIFLVLMCAQGMAGAAGDFSVKGAGLFTCDQMLQHASRDPNVVNTIYTSWLLGYFTGMNSAMAALRNADSTVGRETAPEELRSMLVESCGENPLKSVLQASSEIFERLSKVPRKP